MEKFDFYSGAKNENVKNIEMCRVCGNAPAEEEGLCLACRIEKKYGDLESSFDSELGTAPKENMSVHSKNLLNENAGVKSAKHLNKIRPKNIKIQ